MVWQMTSEYSSHICRSPIIISVLFVANLLDNAIEASRKIEDPKIVIEMKMVKDYLSLTIRNKMDPSMQETRHLPSARPRRIKAAWAWPSDHR